MNKVYMCIDLKSFYASVECRERNLDPLDTNLVVADNSRTEKTICLAVTPSLKKYGLKGRARLFEVVAKIRDINKDRKKNTKNNRFNGKSYLASKLDSNPNLELDYITATPRMSLYMKYSTEIYNIYLKYLAPEDIYVYSIDEVFCDITSYLNTYGLTPEQLVSKMIRDVYETTGITATAGIGTNLYLCKIAMDIVAKHKEANEIGVRIASLDEMSYRRLLWNHTPLTDFWRVGIGYSKRLEEIGIYTMGDVARLSIENEDKLYKLFGVNAELLIDHAWGYEPCSMKDIKSYKPMSSSMSTGQVLHCPYDYKGTKVIVSEMAELLSLDLVDKKVVTDSLVLTIGYDISNVTTEYDGDITCDRYGRSVPKHAHGTINLDRKTSSTKLIVDAINTLYDRIINEHLLVRRVNIAACNLISENEVKEEKIHEQFDLFMDVDTHIVKKEREEKLIKSEKDVQRAIIDIKKKYGKNAILKGMNLDEKGTTMERNMQIGGHKG